jgi:hypothetical protein
MFSLDATFLDAAMCFDFRRKTDGVADESLYVLP